MSSRRAAREVVGAGRAPARGRPPGPPLRFLISVLLLACAGQPATLVEEPLPPVEARASIDRAVATTGDVLTFRVAVDHDPAYAVEIPEAGAEIQGFRIVDISREGPSEVEGRVVRELVYRLRADLVGSYILPSVTVPYRSVAAPEDEVEGAVETSEIFVEVESVLPEDGSAEDIMGLKPLRPIERDRRWWVAAMAAGALALAVLGAWLYRRRRGGVELAPPEPAHERAFRELDALRRADFDDPAAVRRFYFEISEILRTYVEGRFGLNATDLTTEEILRRLPDLSAVGEAERDNLRGFLEHTDQVKFAEHQPTADEIERTYETALGFVEATQPRVEPESEPVEQERAA